MKGDAWELWIALKYVFSSKRESFTSIITIIALIGVVLSVSSLTLVNSIITGFKEVVAEKILSLNPHISINFFSPQEGSKVLEVIQETLGKEIKSIQLTTVQQGLVIKSGQPVGIILKAVDLNRYKQERGFKYFHVFPYSEGTELPVIIGTPLKEKLGIKLGDNLNYLSVQGFYTPFGFFPKFLPLKVVGFFETGIYDYDFNLIFSSFDYFQKKITPQQFSFEIKLKNPFKSLEYKSKLQKKLGNYYYILDWQEWNKNLFSALKMEKMGLFIILSLMVVVSLFTIISAMIMLVAEKKVDIAILRSLGATSKNILKIFLYAGFFLSGIGILLGLSLGSFLALLLSHYPIVKLPSEVYPVEYMPVKLKIVDLLIIASVSFLISLFTSLYPAKKAALLRPAEILRKE